jgi:predicted tellurium resistance membrane protein TerC
MELFFVQIPLPVIFTGLKISIPVIFTGSKTLQKAIKQVYLLDLIGIQNDFSYQNQKI